MKACKEWKNHLGLKDALIEIVCWKVLKVSEFWDLGKFSVWKTCEITNQLGNCKICHDVRVCPNDLKLKLNTSNKSD